MERYELTQTQIGIYLAEMNADGKGDYNINLLYHLDREVDITILKKAMAMVVDRHPFIKSRLQNEEGVLYLEDRSNEPVLIKEQQVRDYQEVLQRIGRPFALLSDSLYRLVIYSLPDGEHILNIDFHHILCDGMSCMNFHKEVSTLYDLLLAGNAACATVAPDRYGFDTCAAERTLRASEALSAAKSWYETTFSAASELDSLPIAQPELVQEPDSHPEQHWVTEFIPLTVNTEDLARCCADSHVGVSIPFTAAFGYALANYTASQQALFATIWHGREKEHFDAMCMNVKTLPVYIDFAGCEDTRNLLSATKTQLSGARSHTVYSFAEATHDLSLTPKACFAYHANLHMYQLVLNGKRQKDEFVRRHRPGFDWALNLICLENGEYQCKFEYDSNAYSSSFIHTFCSCYETILAGLLQGKQLKDLDVVNAETARRLDAFNAGSGKFVSDATMVELFEKTAATYPQNIAVIYKDTQLTYSQLDAKSSALASLICEQVAAPKVVAILIGRSEMIPVCALGALKTGAAYQPLDPSYPQERLHFMVKDSQADVLVCDKELRPLLADYQGIVIYTNAIPDAPRNKMGMRRNNADDLFILLYTSGSTGTPKGVMLSHRNVVAYTAYCSKRFDLQPQHRVLAYASFGFDANMMDLYPTLTTGAALVVAADDIRLDLEALNQYMVETGVTHSMMTTQVGYQFALNYPKHPTLKHLTIGGEKLASLDIPQTYVLHNGYGPTECSIISTFKIVDHNEKNIPIGRPTDSVKCYIVNPFDKRLPWGAAGELVIVGTQVGRGYLNRDDLTAKAFGKWGEEDCYHTGDIVRYREDGDIEFVGRKDGQVKIRGFRIELKEVEAVIRSYEGIRDCTVQAFDAAAGGKYLAAYIVSDHDVDIDQLHAYVASIKPPYMVPAVTMQIERIPLNVNQKVDKKKLPQPQLQTASATHNDTHVLNALEQKLCNMVEELTRQEPSLTNPLIYCGLNSILSMRLSVLLFKQFGIKISGKELLAEASILSIENMLLEQFLKGKDATEQPTSQPQEHVREAPLTFAQQGIYTECLRNMDTTIYNIPMDVCFPLSVGVDRLQKIVGRVLESHPMLFARFYENDEGDTMQACPDECHATIAIRSAGNAQLAEIKREFVRPFDFKKDVLHRVMLVVSDTRLHLLMDVHHLVADGGSVDVMLREIMLALRGEKNDGEDCSYLQFASNQFLDDKEGRMESHKQFFADMLREMEECTAVPADRKLPSPGRLKEVSKPLPALARNDKNITDAAFWFAAAAYTIARYSGVKDVYMTTVSNGRSNPEVASTVGMFVNTLPVVAHIREQQVKEFLLQTNADFRAVTEHENYPFARIAADYGYNADVTYAYQLGIIENNRIDGEEVTIQSFGLDTPKFKLCILIEMKQGFPSLVLQYDDAVYSEQLMNRMADSILAVAQRLDTDAEQSIKTISVMSDNQKAEVLAFARVADAVPTVNTFHEGISRWAELSPDAVAVVAADRTLTYREYNDAAERLARVLASKGVHTGDRIVLLLPRTSDFLVSILAVMKCGAAYIPMDPQYPADRIAYILNDSNGRFVITTRNHMDEHGSKALDITQLMEESRAVHPLHDNLDVTVTPDDLAYLIYTSGSTGQPKGVMLQHKGICNYLTPHPANPHTYEVATNATSVLCSATVSFDLSILEYGTALFNGKTVVFADEQAVMDSFRLAELYNRTGADVLSGTPSRIEAYMEMEEYRDVVKRCKVIQMGGEKLPASLMNRLQSLTDAKIFNMYGPTEITICCNASQLNGCSEVTVGKPLPDFTEYIVDADRNILPVGVMGELIISGVGVSPGYNNLPEKTNEAFIHFNGTRAYKSGDIAKWTEQGNVIILGRTDHQVKLNGLRIELGEIETVMAQQPGIKQCVVLVRKIGNQDRLVAYYVPIAGQVADENAIKAGMAEHLTHYMVPSSFVQMEAFPITPAGKIDTKHLPEPKIDTSSNYVAPATETEKDFCEIFGHVLQNDKVGAEDDFFELGGTSLVAIKVVIAASKKGYEITYSDVFAHPTPKRMAAFVTNAEKEENIEPAAPSQPATVGMPADEYTPLLQRNTMASFLTGGRQPLGTVLLTGATGYLGIHVLYYLLRNTDIPTVYCPVRGKDGMSGPERLRVLLFYYFGDAFDSDFGTRLQVIEGEVTQREWMSQLNVQADTVINCLANVKHFSTGNDIEFVNVESVRNLVIWCCTHNARLVHISTTSVAGRSKDGCPNPSHLYSEQEFAIGQYIDNQYAQSKYDAEKLILDAILYHKLNAKIMRVGNLAARHTDGEFQVNFQSNNFMGTIRAYQTLGVCPYALLDVPCEFSPIDEVAEAVVKLSTTPKECIIFHPTNPHHNLMGDVFGLLSILNLHIRPVEQDEFADILQNALADEQLSLRLRPLMAYKQKGAQMPSIHASNAYTTQVLHRLNFTWSITSQDYMRKLIQAIAGMGYFD